jgi:hypothetical protein
MHLALLPLILLLFHPTTAPSAEAPPVSEETAIALFIVAFTRYVEWPANVSPPADQPIVIGAFGRSAVIDELKSAIAGRSPESRSIRFKPLGADGSEAASCHVVFVHSADARRVSSLLQSLKGKPVLTVGVTDRFVDQGGMIALVRRDNRLKPVVNLDCAMASTLLLSSKLLAVSEVHRGLTMKP